MLGLKFCIIVLLSIGYEYLTLVNSHGMMLDPCSRNSRWRVDRNAPANYDDNGLYCGGYAVQWSAYGGKCGICGDSYGDPKPRPHELHGTFGRDGIPIATYPSGGVFTAVVKITQNHKGRFVFDLCNRDIQPETEECFKPVEVETGGYDYHLNSDSNGFYNVTLKLPKVLCKRCTFRWMYKTGNSWGTCEDGTGAIGCGPQEEFRNCADIAII